MKSRSGSRSQSPHKQLPEVEAESEANNKQNDKEEPSSQNDSNPGNNLYLSNLSYRVKDEDLQEIFKKFGNLIYCKVIQDPKSNLSRGFGFATFEKSEEADKALQEVNNQEIFGRKITIQKAKRGRPYDSTPGKYLGKSKRLYDRSYQEDRGRRRSNSRERSRRPSRYSPRRYSPPRYRNNSSQYRNRSPPDRRSYKRRSRSPRNKY